MIAWSVLVSPRKGLPVGHGRETNRDADRGCIDSQPGSQLRKNPQALSSVRCYADPGVIQTNQVASSTMPLTGDAVGREAVRLLKGFDAGFERGVENAGDRTDSKPVGARGRAAGV
jgi:hypothetical protein